AAGGPGPACGRGRRRPVPAPASGWPAARWRRPAIWSRATRAARRLAAYALEERVGEGPVPLGRAIEVADAALPRDVVDEPAGDRLVADALHHRGERPLREAVHEVRPARVHVHHAGRDLDVVQVGL